MRLEADTGPLEELLRWFKYKPDWTFSIERGLLAIRAIVVDADDPKRVIPVTSYIELPRFVRDEFPWDRWLLDQIIELERHEAMEFFQVAGVKVFDPHKGERSIG